MGFSSYSQVVTPAKWVNPLDLNMVYKDISHKDDIAKQNLDELQQISTQLSSIPAFGADSEYLSKKLQKLKSDMSGLNLTNLGDYNTISQIKGLIGGFKNDEEVLNISQRGNFYSQELQKKTDYEEKGKTYVSPGLDEAEKYYNSGQYIPTKRFNKTGWVSPEVQKLETEYLKNVPKVKKQIKVGNFFQEIESYDLDNLQASLKDLYSRDDVKKDMEYNIGKSLENNGADFSTIGYQKVLESLTQAQQLLQTDPNNVSAKEYIQYYGDLLQNPTQLKEIGKNKMIQEEVDKKINEKIKASQFESEGELKANEFSKIAIQHQNAKTMKLYDLQLKTGLSRNKGETEYDYIERLAKEAERKDINIAQAKQDIKTEGAINLEDKKQENRINILNSKGDIMSIKDNGSKQFNLSGKYVDKKMLIENVARQDKKVIEDIINSNPEEFGNSSGVDPEGFFGIEGGIWFDEKDGIKYANYEANTLVGGTKYKIPLTDIQKYIADPEHIVTVFSENDNYKIPLKGSMVENIEKSNVEESKGVYQGIDDNGDPIYK